MRAIGDQLDGRVFQAHFEHEIDRGLFQGDAGFSSFDLTQAELAGFLHVMQEGTVCKVLRV